MNVLFEENAERRNLCSVGFVMSYYNNIHELCKLLFFHNHDT